MTEAAEKLKSTLAALPPEDRADLARFLIGSLDPMAEQDVEDDWDAELDQRFREIRTREASGEPAASVFADLRKRYL